MTGKWAGQTRAHRDGSGFGRVRRQTALAEPDASLAPGGTRTARTPGIPLTGTGPCQRAASLERSGVTDAGSRRASLTAGAGSRRNRSRQPSAVAKAMADREGVCRFKPPPTGESWHTDAKTESDFSLSAASGWG